MKCSFCHTSSESIIHLFWSCRQTSHFWNKLTEWLKNLNLLPKRLYFDKCYCFGSEARYLSICTYQLLLSLSIWLAKTRDDHPNLTHFICTLKSQYEIETKSGDTKKWKPLTGYMRIQLIF